MLKQLGKINGYYIAILLAIVFSWWGLLDTKASEYVSSSLVQALSAFGLAKLFNATVSVLQSIQISVFVSSVTIGELLDPFNDMVEDFSGVMKVAVSSLIFQSILLKIIATVYFKAFVTLSGLLFGYLYWVKSRFIEVAYKVFVTAVGAKFLLVLVVLLSALVDASFLNEEKTQTMDKIQVHSDEMNEVTTGLGVAADLKQSLDKDKQTIQIKLDEQQNVLSNHDARLVELTAQNESLNHQIAARKEILSTLDILFNNDEILADLRTQQSALSDDRQRTEQNIKTSKNKINALQQSIDDLGNLTLEDQGFFASIKQSTFGLSHFKDKISEYVGTLNGLVNDFLTLLALFAFNTVLIPVLFLYLGAKGFKLVWQMKPSDLIERAKQGVKKSL
ncbi:coiled-coil domain-containing protein [Marinomonas polaris]|uniref:coiled-coil domain-containing protein n=1 Tax=Marinomonas polaris TaxID=293552 RepID=UPI003F97C44F